MKLFNCKQKLPLLPLAAVLAMSAPRAQAQAIYATPYNFAPFAGNLTNPQAVAVDNAGNIYVANFVGQTIVKIDPSGNETTLAGNGSAGVVNANGGNAEFDYPLAIAVDSAGNVYTADLGAQTIRKIDTSGNVTTIAGSPGVQGHVDGNGSAAQFDNPEGMTVDHAGNVYVADASDNSIRKIDTSGNVTTLAGSPNGQTGAGQADGRGTSAQFSNPAGLAVDQAGNIYVADENNDTIRKIDTSGNVTTIAGSAGAAGYTDAQGSAVRFRSPSNLAVDSAGNIYVSDQGNSTVRKIDTAGNVTSLATGFNIPTGIGVDSSGNLYVSEDSNNRVEKGTFATPPPLSFTHGGFYNFNTYAGLPGTSGTADGNGTSARFDNPNGVAVDRAGNVYVADFAANTIRKIDSSANVTTLAGNGVGAVVNANGSAAEFFNPIAPAVDAAGNVFVADYSGNTIRKIDPSANVTTLAGGSQGSADGQGSAAQFNNPNGLAVDAADNVYVSDLNNYTIRKIDTGGNVITWAGSAGNVGNSDGQGGAASFYNPQGLAVDHAGNVYVADTGNDMIRKIDSSANVTTIAGLANYPGSADGPPGVAQFNNPTGVAVDAAGNVYVTDQSNVTIRKIDPFGNTTTLGGVAGAYGSANGFGSEARFNLPDGIAVDTSGNLYVSEYSNARVTKGVYYPNVLILSWPGNATLQTAAAAQGPYTPVLGSGSPFNIVLPGANTQGYYGVW